MMQKRSILVAAVGVSALVLAASIPIACGSSDTPSAAPLDTTLGSSCENPLPLAETIALSPLPPTPNGLVALSGDPGELVEEGSVGLVANASGSQSLAVNVHGRPVPIPGSDGVLRALGAALVGTPHKLLVFSRTALTARSTFAGKIVYGVAADAWSLEIRVLDGEAKVVASKSFPRPRLSVEPLGIEVVETGRANVLVKSDARGVLGNMSMPDEGPSPIAMQIFDLALVNGALEVVENESEPADREQFAALAGSFLPPPSCPVNSCGIVLDEAGQEIECGSCHQPNVCSGNVCVPPESFPTGACQPRSRGELCGGGACGKRYDGCSDVIDCGGCGGGLVCGLEQPGVCGDPIVTLGAEAKAVFGAATCGCFRNATGRTVSVECAAGQRCKEGTCVAN